MSSRPSSFVQNSTHSFGQTLKRHLRQWMKPDNLDLVLNAAMDLTRGKPELVLENMLLRQQLIVLKGQMKRPALSWRDRTLFVLLASKLPTWRQALVIVQPETVVLAEYSHPFQPSLAFRFAGNHPKGSLTLNG